MANNLKLEVILQAIDRATAPIRAVTKSSTGLGRALKESRDQLKALQAQQKDISSLRTQREAVRQTSETLASAQQRLRGMREQLQGMDAPSAKFQKSFAAAAAQVDKLKAKHGEQRAELQRLVGQFKRAGVSTKDMGQVERDLQARLDQTNSKISEQTRRLQALSIHSKRAARAKEQFDKAQQVAGGMAASGAGGLASGYAIAKPLQGIVDAFAPAENAATQLRVSMMDRDGQVAADFQRITDLATKLGDRLPGTTADFQDMMTMLRRQGISAQSILGGTGEAAAYLGVQLQKPVADAAEFAAKMQDATRTTEKDMMGLMDAIQRAYYLGVDDTNMLQGFSKISPVMDIIKKQGLEAANTFAPLLVMMDQTGMAGESAGNAFRKVFQGAMATDKIDKVLKDLKTVKGISLNLDFTDGKGEFAGIDNLFKQLDKLKTLNTSDRLSIIKDLFGDDSETLQVLNTMMNKGIAGYQEVAAKMENQADLRTRVNEQLATLTNTIEAAQGSWTNAMSEIGATIAPELKTLINDIGEVAVRVKDWVKANPALSAAIFKTAAGLALLLTVGGGITLMLASFLGPFAMVRYGLALFTLRGAGLVSTLISLGRVALPLVLRGVLLIGRALMLNPIGLAVTAIAGAAYLIYKNWEPIKAFFLGMWAEVKAGFSGGLAGIARTILNFSPIGLFYRAFAAVMGYFGVDLPSRFSEFGSSILTSLMNGLSSQLEAFKAMFAGLWTEVQAGVNGGLSGILRLIADFSPLGLFYRAFAGVLSYFGVELPGKFSDFGSMLLDGLVNGIRNKLGDVKTAISEVGDSTVGWFKEKLGIHSPSRVFAELGGFTMAGLEQGLTDGQKGPLAAVLDLAKQLTTAGALNIGAAGSAMALDTRPPLSPAGSPAAAAVQPAPVTINVYGAPGMNEQHLARLVAIEVAKLQARDQVRNRSRITDQD